MSKAVLIMDMPSGCVKCPLYDYVPTRCFATDKFQNNTSEDFKPNWCPLRELPEYKEENHTSKYTDIKNEGYNACIDELLKEE